MKHKNEEPQLFLAAALRVICGEQFHRGALFVRRETLPSSGLGATSPYGPGG